MIKPPDPRELPAFSYAQAHRILDIPASTIRAWKKGQAYIYQGERRRFDGPIPSPHPRGMSYYDLVEAFVLRSLRVEYNYPLHYIREALAMAWEEFGIRRLFLHADFRFERDGREFFLDRYTHLASLSRGRQAAISEALSEYLSRVEYGGDKMARCFYPVPRNRGTDSPRVIVINPFMSFGRPVVERVGIRTASIYDRIDAGEDENRIMAEYNLEPQELVEALNFEAAAAA